MAKLKIVGWTHFDCEYPTAKCSGDRLNEEINLIRQEIATKGYMFAGEDHQCELTGVPVFSDGTCFRASMRCWGEIMASLFTNSDGEDCTYMDFYMSLDDDAVMPEFTDIDVEPAVLEEVSDGCTTKTDREIVQESLDLGMAFMTNDKVLKKLYLKRKAEQKK